MATISWNVIEATVAISSGLVAGSIALVGFGIDAGIEVFSAVVVLWRLRGIDDDREDRALRLIGVSFFALAAYVTFEATRDLITGSEPETSATGIAIAVLSLIVMPLLAVAKHRTGHAMGSRVVIADAAETKLCTYLSAVLLVGLVANATVGWWWADSLAALVIAYLAFQEGRVAWRGEHCCDTKEM
jgi:divalent metal cation (Fe/Co/Zn/Cd) transporter